MLLPPDMRAWLPEGDLALFISNVVNEPDLSGIYQACESGEGRAVIRLTHNQLKLSRARTCLAPA